MRVIVFPRRGCSCVAAAVFIAGVSLQPLHGHGTPPAALCCLGSRWKFPPLAALASERRCAMLRLETAPFMNERSEPGECRGSLRASVRACVRGAGAGPARLQVIGQLASLLLLMLLSSPVLLSSSSSQAKTGPALICPLFLSLAPSFSPTLVSLCNPLLSTAAKFPSLLFSLRLPQQRTLCIRWPTQEGGVMLQILSTIYHFSIIILVWYSFSPTFILLLTHLTFEILLEIFQIHRYKYRIGLSVTF